MNLVYLAIVWIVCGIIAYGIMFAYLQRAYNLKATKENHISDKLFCIFFGMFGPFGILIISFFRAVCIKDILKYGMKLK